MPNYNDLRPADDHKKKDYALVFPKMDVSSPYSPRRYRLVRWQLLRKNLARDSDLLLRKKMHGWGRPIQGTERL